VAWLDSSAEQTRQPDEIVLCDAGSTDGTIDRIEAQAASDPRIRLIVEPGANVPRRSQLRHRGRGEPSRGGPVSSPPTVCCR
jgi:glycosyltransferase involved in cell wall biosynthesis